MNALPEALEALTSRVDALEKRVHELEHPPRHSRRESRKSSCDVPRRRKLLKNPGIEQASGVFPVLGSAMLGIAGAYVLRAVAESSPVPRQAIAAVAIAYAVAWLVWAARQRTPHPLRVRSTRALPP